MLLIASVVLVRLAVPSDPREAGAWLSTRAGTVALPMNLMRLSGIAFLWFIGVLRDRLGGRKDRLFATAFLGSGLNFLAMLFVSAAMVGAILLVYSADRNRPIGSTTFTFARVIVYEVVNIDAIKMSGVFMVVTSTLALRTRFLARWIALLSQALALVMILASRHIDWILLVFPLWVLLIGLYMLGPVHTTHQVSVV